MGIFQKKNTEDNIFVPANLDEEGGESMASDDNESSGMKSSGFKYGIEEAVNLMRKLPDVDSEVIITVVKKTLESANIKVPQIIEDAEKKETNINRRTQTLTSEIDELQEKISLRNKEISTLSAELKETTKVKKLLKMGEENSKKEKQKSKASVETNDTKSEDSSVITAHDLPKPDTRPAESA